LDAIRKNCHSYFYQSDQLVDFKSSIGFQQTDFQQNDLCNNFQKVISLVDTFYKVSDAIVFDHLYGFQRSDFQQSE